MARKLISLLVLAAAVLGCNLLGSSSLTPPPPGEGTPLPDGGGVPAVVIDSPANGSQGILGQTLTIRVHASDGVGITRVVLRESGRIVVSQPSPDPVPNFEALLPYKPSRMGSVTLEVIAYRGTSESAPAALSLDIVGSAGELRNPGSLDPTSGAASGSAVCTGQVNVNNLNLRAGPGTNYDIITKLGLGENLNVIGRNQDTSWLQIRRGGGVQGWVSAQYLNLVGDCSQAPIVSP